MAYRIGSFNVLELYMNPGKSRDDNQAAKHIPEIIRKYDFDVVALQEVHTPKAMHVLQQELGADRWGAIHASSFLQNTSDTSKEYGYLWRHDRLDLVRDPLVYSEIKKRVDRIWQNHIDLQIGRADERLEEEDALAADTATRPHAPSVAFAERKRHLIEAFKAALIRPPLVCCFRPGGGMEGIILGTQNH